MKIVIDSKGNWLRFIEIVCGFAERTDESKVFQR